MSGKRCGLDGLQIDVVENDRSLLHAMYGAPFFVPADVCLSKPCKPIGYRAVCR